MNAARSAEAEIMAGDRFAFGENWTGFLDLVDDVRISMAIESLKSMLSVSDLKGLSFLDIGSGSGLFSLAARRLGAEVTSFDYDASSVACTAEMRRRFAPDDPQWTVTRGSVLDSTFLRSLGTFDIVYSWGVLHHTGDMWSALKNTVPLVSPRGRLYISIYNDQGRASRVWTRVKAAYNTSGRARRRLILLAVSIYFRYHLAVTSLLRIARRGQNEQHQRGRGMDRRHDLVDWVGGWPFEVAKPELVFNLFRERGFELLGLKTCAGGIGCNELLFGRK